jgi:cobalt-zinc-cadmium efflux system protein
MHDHTHGHDHAHGAHAHVPNNGRAFAIGTALNLAFVAIELAYGLYANSLALLADAGHNFSDVIGLLLAWGAATLATRGPSPRFTYGLRGTTILAALANAMLLLVATGAIAWEALRRFSEPSTVSGWVVIWVALAGVVINTATALLFMRDRKSDLNIRGAYLHMAADAGVSLGVVAAGIGMLYTGWLWLDPAVSLGIAIVILIGTWGLLRESTKLALHAVPDGIDPSAVRLRLEALPGVQEVHDLHVWGMSTTETALTAHLVMPGGHPGDDFIANAAHELQHDFNIGHATLQVETATASAPCALAPDHVV